MKVDLNELITGLHGKSCRARGAKNAPIFALNSQTGVQIAYHIHNPYKGPASAAQKASTVKFKEASQKARQALNDESTAATIVEGFKKQRKYATLFGYAFSLQYNKEG